jgi:hypothetical protein
MADLVADQLSVERRLKNAGPQWAQQSPMPPPEKYTYSGAYDTYSDY